MVRDAGGSASSTLAEANNSPESKSIKSHALAAMAGALGANASCAANGITVLAEDSDFLEVSDFLVAECFGACCFAASSVEVEKTNNSVVAKMIEILESFCVFIGCCICLSTVN